MSISPGTVHGDRLRAQGSVLVTGAAGLIGSATVAHLLARGERVVALDNRRLDPLQHAWNERQLLTVVADATDEESVRNVFIQADRWTPIDRVAHLAARPNMNAGSAVQVFGTNVVSTFALLAIAGEVGVRRAVIASSIHATGLLKHHLRPMPDRFPLDEQQSVHLDDWYSLSKQVDEMSAQMASSHWNLPVVALRFPLVQPLNRLAVTAERYDRDPARMMREGWTYLADVEAARAIACSLDATSTGVVVAHVAAPDTLLSINTEDALDRYAPGVPRTKVFRGREAPMDTSRAARELGFIARSRCDLQASYSHGSVFSSQDASA